ncbi:unnamed protein product [Calicophoron daubneyi]|uniref:Uncharacterized protein n=1 Tax=Calicophoron daubneyi TaxID=300641 RepID=A0AAV2TI47_CALDB
MNSELPEYVLNRNMIAAVRKDNAGYIAGMVRSYPWLLDSLFYSERKDDTLGLFEHKWKPPVICLFTLFAYAINYASKRVISKLISLKADIYKSCFVADLMDDAGPEPSYRVKEMPPVSIISPFDEGFRLAAKVGYDLSRQFSVVTTIYHDKEARNFPVVYRGFWEFCLGVSKKMQHPKEMVEITNTILSNGYDTNVLLRQLDLFKLFSRYFHLIPGRGLQDADDVKDVIAFMNTMIRHGCCLTEKPVANGFNKVITELLRTKCHTDETREEMANLISCTAALSPDLTFSQKHDLSSIEAPPNSLEQLSLAAGCVRVIRPRIGGKRFYERVQRLNCKQGVKHCIIFGQKDPDEPKPELTPYRPTESVGDVTETTTSKTTTANQSPSQTNPSTN